jgi:hypothetical protein
MTIPVNCKEAELTVLLVNVHAGVCTDAATGDRYIDIGAGVGAGLGVGQSQTKQLRTTDGVDADTRESYSWWNGRTGTNRGSGSFTGPMNSNTWGMQRMFGISTRPSR